MFKKSPPPGSWWGTDFSVGKKSGERGRGDTGIPYEEKGHSGAGKGTSGVETGRGAVLPQGHEGVEEDSGQEHEGEQGQDQGEDHEKNDLKLNHGDHLQTAGQA